jgi:GDP-4-dehydro-6-deoxy-D-mannose reductase
LKTQRVLITGSNGFVGGYLSEALQKAGCQVFGMGLEQTDAIGLAGFYILDITQADQVEAMVKEVTPDLIFHLAGISSVGLSYKEPELTHEVNVGGTQNLLEAVRRHSPACRTVIISSAEVYAPKATPVAETDALDPHSSPYAASRVGQEGLLSIFADLDIVVSRSFNHIGPRQTDAFVSASFAKQVAEILLGLRPTEIEVGNLSAVRDFTDVRDMVTAYLLLAEQGKRGEVYNLGSGVGLSISELLDKLVAISGEVIEVKVSQERFRPVDNPVLIADVGKFKQLTQWQPQIGLAKTLTDMLEYWQFVLEKK